MKTALVCLGLAGVIACARSPRDPPPAPLPDPAPTPSPEAAAEPVTIVEPTLPPDAPPAPVAMAAAEVAAAPPPSGCGAPGAPPPTRSAGGLTVPSVPTSGSDGYAGRMRHHVDGSLGARARRTWVGPPVPAFVPLTSGTLELFLLDHVPTGYFALYRDPYDASSCKGGNWDNCAFEIAAFDCRGRETFRVPLAKYLSRKDHLEVQDARYVDGVVYFNEACQTYSSAARGQCSSLVAFDPHARRVLWRTPPLTSNNRIMVYDRYVVAGYGFTAEPDFLFVVRRRDGAVLQKVSLPSAPEDLVDGPGSIVAVLEPGRGLLFSREGFDGPSPRLVLQGATEKLAGP